MARRYGSLYERLVANTRLSVPGNPQSCWLWKGRANHGGYPSIAVRVPGGGRATPPKNRAAHRAMLEEVLDAEFPHDEAGHLCGNPRCVNPDHLEPQTKAHNLAERRGYRSTPNGKSWIPVLYPRSNDDWVPF